MEQNSVSVLRRKSSAVNRKIGDELAGLGASREATAGAISYGVLRTSPWVFPSARRKHGESTHLTTVMKAFARALSEAGLPKNLGSVLRAT